MANGEYYGIIATRKGAWYIAEEGREYETDALLRAEELCHSENDYGVVGTIHVTTLHREHPCPALIPNGKFVQVKD